VQCSCWKVSGLANSECNQSSLGCHTNAVCLSPRDEKRTHAILIMQCLIGSIRNLNQPRDPCLFQPTALPRLHMKYWEIPLRLHCSDCFLFYHANLRLLAFHGHLTQIATRRGILFATRMSLLQRFLACSWHDAEWQPSYPRHHCLRQFGRIAVLER